MERKSYTIQEATEKLSKFCAYRERCHKEVEQKLWEMNMIPEARNQIIMDLMEDGFLNEERFARSFARGKFKIKKWGRHRIERELKRRDISKWNIERGLSEISPEAYHQALEELIAKRRKQIDHESKPRQRSKMVNYLAYRGYEYALIYEKLRDLNFL